MIGLKVLKYLESTLFGLSFGMLISLLLSLSIWIEMRINTAYTIPFCAAISILGLIKSKKEISRTLLLLPLAGFIMAFSAVYGIKTGAWLVIPAALLRDGLFLEFLTLSQINWILASLFLGIGTCFIIKK